MAAFHCARAWSSGGGVAAVEQVDDAGVGGQIARLRAVDEEAHRGAVRVVLAASSGRRAAGRDRRRAWCRAAGSSPRDRSTAACRAPRRAPPSPPAPRRASHAPASSRRGSAARAPAAGARGDRTGLRSSPLRAGQARSARQLAPAHCRRGHAVSSAGRARSSGAHGGPVARLGQAVGPGHGLARGPHVGRHLQEIALARAVRPPACR